MELLQKSLSETETVWDRIKIEAVKESKASGYTFSVKEEQALLSLPMPNYKLL